jgi:PKD repeat protein
MAYAINRGGTTAEVDVIDTTSHTLVSTIALASDASAIAITPDARFALVVLTGNLLGVGSEFGGLPAQTPPSPEVVAIDTSTNKLVAGTAPLPGRPPVSIAISPDGSSAFVVKTFGFCGTGCNATGTVTPITVGAGAALTARPSFLLPNSDVPVDAAVSTDGKTLYVLTSSGFLDGFALPGLALTSTTGIPASANHLVLSPNGKTAYISIGAAQFGYPPPGYILPVALGAKPAPGTPIPLPAASGTLPSDPGTLAIATTPAGQSILYVGDPVNVRVVGIPIPGGAPSPLSLNLVEDNARSLFATPDGSTVEMTTSGRNLTVNITGAANAPGALGTCFRATPITCPPGDGAIAVTPDQRPVASFVATAAGPGQPSSFDASSSTIAYGTIANYHWDFGDGSSEDTASPTTTHPYAATGNYTVSLTETDWAGTSVSTSAPSTVFTGQTMTRRGGPEAQTTRRVTIPSKPTTPLPSLTPTFRPPPPGSPTPKISLLPKVGPPGTVVAVSGSDFPANTAVSLAWQPGIGTAAVTTSPAGTFTNRLVLVLPKDRLGGRLMVAQTFGATATFLVVPPSIAPGGHGAELSLLFRR